MQCNMFLYVKDQRYFMSNKDPLLTLEIKIISSQLPNIRVTKAPEHNIYCKLSAFLFYSKFTNEN